MTLGTLNYSRMSDLAYQELRDAILSGQLGSASRLNQDELARRLGVSRAPVRDAPMRVPAAARISNGACVRPAGRTKKKRGVGSPLLSARLYFYRAFDFGAFCADPLVFKRFSGVIS